MIQFPKDFFWGAATSAPQTEGASFEDGKSASTWDKWFELNPENFNAHQGPDTTSDLYHRYKTDLALMTEIHMNSYRTSIAWTRLLPDGKTLNPAAVAYYRDYFSGLLARGITPIINLFHFDMPWWLMEIGGFENRKSVDAFAFYAKTAFEQFGDLVKYWTTFNEPIVHVECGYLGSDHYPAIHDFKRAVQVGYHTLMAHVYAVEAFRKLNLKDGKIGIILNISPAYARSESKADQLAKKCADALLCESYLDPAVLGKFPEFLIQLLSKNQLLPDVVSTDNTKISQNTVDFIGLNYYQPLRVQAPQKAHEKVRALSDLFEPYLWPERKMNTYRGWEIYPEALYDVALMMKNKYHNLPWYVSENGMGVADETRFLDENGMIQDDYRIEFMKAHLKQLHKGIQAGSNCFGYHAWTFIDCWSWRNGYRNRYGFYQLDLSDHFKRKVKKSGLWFKALAQSNQLDTDDLD